MKVIITPAELMNRGMWPQAVSLLGLEQVLIETSAPVELTGRQAWEIGLLSPSAYKREAVADGP